MEDPKIGAKIKLITDKIEDYLYYRNDQIQIQIVLAAISKQSNRFPKHVIKESLHDIGYSLGSTFKSNHLEIEEIKRFRQKLYDLIPFLQINSRARLEAFIAGIAEALQTTAGLLMLSLGADDWLRESDGLDTYSLSEDSLPQGATTDTYTLPFNPESCQDYSTFACEQFCPHGPGRWGNCPLREEC